MIKIDKGMVFYFSGTIFLIYILAVLINFAFDSIWIGIAIGTIVLIIYLFIMVEKYASLVEEDTKGDGK